MMKPDHQRSKLISFHPPGLYGQPFDFSYMKFKTLQQINKEHNPKNVSPIPFTVERVRNRVLANI